MPRRRSIFPALRLHAPSGRAVVTVRLTTGRRRDIYCGTWDSPEAEDEYHRVVGVLAAHGGRYPAPTPAPAVRPDVTVAELIAAFKEFAEGRYRRPDGTPTNEVREYAYACRIARGLFGGRPAREFDGTALAAVRDQMVATGWCRRRVNKQVRRVKRLFRWGVARNFVPPDAAARVEALETLRKGETAARETERRRPVPDDAVAATLPFLRPPVAAIVRLLRLTGARPEEICALTLGRVDRSGPVWEYRPGWHKGAQADRDRVIYLGPQAQAVLVAFLGGWEPGPDESVFSPARDKEERLAAWRRRRKSKVPPSQRNRRKEAPARVPGAWYTPIAVAHAVTNAVAKANARRAALAAGAAFEPVPAWSPYQLRHARATEVRKLYGVEHAGAVLGHSKVSATETYTHTDRSRAARVAAEVG